MAQDFGMHQKTQQRMVMTPMLQQAMKILQLSTMELKEWVEKEMTENPVLEEDAEEAPASDKTSPSEASGNSPEESASLELEPPKLLDRHQTDLVEKMKEGDRFEKATWDMYQESQEYGEFNDSEWGGRESSSGEQEKRDFMEASITRAETLAEHLEWQLLMLPLDEKQKALGLILIGNLDESGYLSDSLEEMAASLKVSLGEAEKVLSILQTLDPPGVGARNLRECLLIQLESKKGEMAGKAYQLVLNHFEDMEKRRYASHHQGFGLWR